MRWFLSRFPIGEPRRKSCGSVVIGGQLLLKRLLDTSRLRPTAGWSGALRACQQQVSCLLAVACIGYGCVVTVQGSTVVNQKRVHEAIHTSTRFKRTHQFFPLLKCM